MEDQRSRRFPATVPLTRHAGTRMQQRGIPGWMVEVLLDYGAVRHDGRGGQVITLPRRARRQLARELPRTLYVAAERHFGVYAVTGADGALITVGHRTARLTHQ